MKIYTNFNQERNEIFFSKKVILVEGATEKIFISTLFENILNIDLDRLGISVVECGGKNGVKYFVGVCRLLGQEEYFAIWDTDGQDTSTQEPLWTTLQEGKGLEYVTNFEVEFGLPRGADVEKVLNAFQFANRLTPDTVPDKFSRLKAFILDTPEKTGEVVHDEHLI